MAYVPSNLYSSYTCHSSRRAFVAFAFRILYGISGESNEAKGARQTHMSYGDDGLRETDVVLRNKTFTGTLYLDGLARLRDG